MNLVESDCFRRRTLCVAYSTVGELMHIDFHLAEDFLYFVEDDLYNGRCTCELQVVDVFAHDAREHSIVVSVAHLRIHCAGDQTTFVSRDFGEFH